MSPATAPLDFPHPTYTQIVTQFNVQNKIMWCFMDPKPRSCFTFSLLEDLRRFQVFLEGVNRRDGEPGFDCPIQYMVLTSRTPKVFSFGGDLELFARYIRERNRSGLLRYAKACIDVLYPNSVNYDLPMTTISLIQGDALGGGFEAALSGNVLIAEKGAQFGFPEVMFNLFPGMGAYSLLSRRIGAAQAERIITGASVYSASEMHRIGVVDVLAENGEGEAAVCEYVAKHARKRNALQSLLRVRHRCQRIDRQELMDVAGIWVDAAMNVGSKELRLMERLVRAQDRMLDADPATPVIEVRA